MRPPPALNAYTVGYLALLSGIVVYLGAVALLSGCIQ